VERVAIELTKGVTYSHHVKFTTLCHVDRPIIRSNTHFRKDHSILIPMTYDADTPPVSGISPVESTSTTTDEDVVVLASPLYRELIQMNGKNALFLATS
jgi:hypothetical protein